MRDGALTAVLDFGGLSLGDPTVDLVVAWEVLDPPARELFRRQVGVDDATWLRGRAWALSITLMIWYYWTTMPERRARCMAVGRDVPGRRGLRGVTPSSRSVADLQCPACVQQPSCLRQVRARTGACGGVGQRALVSSSLWRCGWTGHTSASVSHARPNRESRG